MSKKVFRKIVRMDRKISLFIATGVSVTIRLPCAAWCVCFGCYEPIIGVRKFYVLVDFAVRYVLIDLGTWDVMLTANSRGLAPLRANIYCIPWTWKGKDLYWRHHCWGFTMKFSWSRASRDIGRMNEASWDSFSEWSCSTCHVHTLQRMWWLTLAVW